MSGGRAGVCMYFWGFPLGYGMCMLPETPPPPEASTLYQSCPGWWTFSEDKIKVSNIYKDQLLFLKCYWKLKISHARPFFPLGNCDISSGRPHQKFINHNFIDHLKKMAKRDHFSFKEIAIFHQVAPIKNSLTIILCARSAEKFWIHHWFWMNFLKKFFE